MEGVFRSEGASLVPAPISSRETETQAPSLKSLMQLKKKYDAPDVASLPDGYKQNSDKERLYLWSAGNFRRQIQHKHPTLKPLCLTSKNECGTEKLVMTFIRVI